METEMETGFTQGRTGVISVHGPIHNDCAY